VNGLPTPCLLGPTASGKSEVALLCARATRGEVVSCDAFAVYRDLPILSAAPVAPPDVPHHLVGVLGPGERFSAADFVEAADRVVAEVRARGGTPWIAGGTALYLRSWLKGLGAPVPRDALLRARLVEEARTAGTAALHARLAQLDPARAAQVHPHDERRLIRALEIIEATGAPASAARSQWTGPDRVPARLVGLHRSAEDLERRIDLRTTRMFQAGVLDEARRFLAAAPSPEARMALGLDVLAEVLEGRRTEALAAQEIARRTRRFVRKQLTFFRSFAGVTWLEVAPDEAPDTTAERVLAACRA
jgi:tRNA dimethylallyltransferase